MRSKLCARTRLILDKLMMIYHRSFTMHVDRAQSLFQAWQKFLAAPLTTRLQILAPDDLESSVLARFQQVVATVPAYQAFLQTHRIDPAKIENLSDYRQLPLTTKDNYLRCHSLPHLCRQGALATCDMISVSSGSTGQPSFWPRSLTDEFQVATRFEQVFHDSFGADQRATLAVICFALGTWVGGVFTANCCRHLASKGYPITVITPGNQPAEILRVVQALAPQFEQTVLLGYPPFLKQVVDTGLAQGVPWSSYQVKLVMAGEVFSEEWRSLVGERLGSTDFCYDFASLYGTADAGVLGNETPLSICIRRWLAERPDVARALFGESRLPTLVQYDPRDRFFEVEEGTLLFSGDNGIPLIRYHIADQGGLIGYDEMLQFLASQGFDPLTCLSDKRGVYPLPFVYVFGRSHFTVSYFGANIYSENIMVGLEQSPICDWVTGKFVMQVKEDADRDRVLTIAVELAPGHESSEAKEVTIAAAIRHHLCRLNREFAHYVPVADQTPQISLHPMGDAEYFPTGVKHRYTRRS